MIDLVLFFGVLAALALAYPWSVARRFTIPVSSDATTIRERYERRYRRSMIFRIAPAFLLAYFLVRGLTTRSDDASLRDVATPLLLAFVALYLMSVLGAIFWRYSRDREFIGSHPEFADSLQPLWVRLSGFTVLAASLALFGAAFVVEGDTFKGMLVVLGFAVFFLGQRATLAIVVRSRVLLPLDSPTGRCLAETVERFGFTPRQIVLIPSTITNAYALPNGTVMITTALRTVLTDEETAAVVAHELSHARDGDVRKIYRFRILAVLCLGIAGGALGGGLALYERSFFFLLATGLCAGLVLGQFVALAMARMTQRMEHKCDADAKKIGLGPAMESGLIKIHRYMGLPERWIGVDRRLASHPSLDKRLAKLQAS